MGSEGHRAFINLGPGNDRFQGNKGSNGVFGGDGTDAINGGAGVDVQDGGSGNDHLFGEGGSDLLYGNGGNDELVGGSGDDFIDGGDGDKDIAIYAGRFSEYTLAFNAQGILVVEDSTSGRDGKDSLINLEFARFTNQDILISSLQGAPNTAPTDISIITSSLDENITAGSAVGTLFSTDANSGNTFTYSLAQEILITALSPSTATSSRSTPRLTLKSRVPIESAYKQKIQVV
jgi:hypothetical protein